MVLTSHPKPKPSSEICKYLQSEFQLSSQAIELAIKQSSNENAPLSIILWSYGLISLGDYQKFLDWLDENKSKD